LNVAQARSCEPAYRLHGVEVLMLKWFQAVMPREERFYPLFIRHSELIVACAEALDGLLKNGDEAARYCQEIREREQDADDITREVHLAVRRTFITPFDRSDIRDLINAMDDAIDEMHHTANTVALYELRSFEPTMQQMGGFIVKSSRLVAEAMPLLSAMGKHNNRLSSLTDDITRHEGRVDDLHDEGLKLLYREHRQADPMAFIIGSEIYDHLEKVADSLDDVANEINGILIEHL
jgi:uncharacterized protein